MRVRVNKKDIVTELRVLKSFQVNRDDKAFRIRAEGEVVRIEAFTLNAHLLTSVPAMVLEPGEFCVEKTRFVDVIRSLAGKDFGISVEGNRLLVEDDAFSASFVGCNELRKRPEQGLPTATHVVPAPMLSDMIATASFAIPVDDAMSDKLGLLLEAEDGVTRLVATNGHCLALIEEPVGGVMRAQMPRRVVSQLQTVLFESYKDVTLRVHETTLEVIAGQRHLTTMLPSMAFPDYRRIMASAAVQAEATISTEPALRALQRICAVSDAEVPGVAISADEAVTLGDTDSSDAIESTGRTGPAFTIRVNAHYLIAALSASGQAVVLRSSGATRPLMLSPVEGRRTFIIAPMQVTTRKMSATTKAAPKSKKKAA